jgi:VanZ family protein
MRPFRYSPLWLSLGWLGIGMVIYLSLTSAPVAIPMTFGDKLGHLLAYGVLMGWFVQLYQRRAWLLGHAVLLLLLGITLEFLQELNGRYFEYADMLANGLGILLGAATMLTPWRDALQRLERRFTQQA